MVERNLNLIQHSELQDQLNIKVFCLDGDNSRLLSINSETKIKDVSERKELQTPNNYS